MTLGPGTRVGPYEVVAPIGAGGMGEVFRATDSTLKRPVALKVLPASFKDDGDRLARFQREAEVLASLNHPNIAHVYGVVEDGGVRALVMELVEGPTLADRLAQGPLPLDEALSVARQIADALEEAHERGIVHRDLKPANVKVHDDGTVKVLDFGLAKTTDPGGALSAQETTTSPAMTHAGVILGTAAYMAPEQARGKAVDRRADIWSFGVVLYEMLTGRRLFRGDEITDVLAAVITSEPDLSVLPVSTPHGVRRLLRRCLQKDVRRRLRDIADAKLELDEAADRGSSSDETGPVPDRRRRPSRLALALVGVALAAAAWLGWLAGQGRAANEVPTFDRMVRLVSSPAHEFGPVISPDGKWVAYLSNARGPTDVWVKFIAGGDAVNLTASSDLTVQSADHIGGLAVSPDGAQLAFQAQGPQQLGGTWVIPVPLGGAPRRLLSVGSSGMQWSADGARVAFVKTGGPLGDALMIADADGQNEVEIVRREGGRHIHWVRWDSTGRWAYFNHGIQTGNNEPSEIFRAPAAGGPSERVVATARRAVSPFPSPDGRGLFYAANPYGVDLSLWWRDLASGRDYQVTTGVGEYNSPTVSADGRRLAGTVLDVRQTLQRLDVTGGRLGALQPLTDGSSGDVDPAWAPDGSRLVFSSSRTGSRTLWTARPDLSHVAPLTSGAAIDERPAYSPDGRQVAFVSDRGGRRGIWLVSAEAGAPRLVTAVDVIDTVSWSPDGRRLVISAPAGDAPGLMLVDVASGRMERVKTPGAATRPAWSPRADCIAYVEPRGGNVGAFLRFVSSSGEPLYDRPDVWDDVNLGNGFVSWSPDGRRLAAVSLPGAFDGSLWIVDADAASPFSKQLDLPTGVVLRGLAWSPDASSLVVGRISLTGDIVFAERSAEH